jgi:hypothetical protein
MSTIYVLRLVGDRYYVGRTDNLKTRYAQHEAGKGSAWTRKYKPIEIAAQYEASSQFDEDKYTKMYMDKHGIDRVRGGSYSQVYLSPEQHDALRKEIWSANNKCMRCGYGSHFANRCHAKRDVEGYEIDDSYSSDSSNDSYSD